MESYRESALAEHGVTDRFIQDNHSRSTKGTLRGVHFQYQPGQAKLVRCAHGKVWDVAVDLRQGSPTFGAWEGFELSDENAKELYIPVGFGHGFCVLSDSADFVYKCSSYYDGATEGSLAYNDPEIGIQWPIDQPLVSARDQEAPSLSDIQNRLSFKY